MSGGHYDYKNFYMHDIAQAIDNDVENNESGEYPMSEETIKRMKIISHLLHLTGSLTYFADYLYSGDSGEETFIRRFDELYIPGLRDLNDEG
jgi:hypothetical protein